MTNNLKIVWIQPDTKKRFLDTKGEGMTADRYINQLLDLESNLKSDMGIN